MGLGAFMANQSFIRPDRLAGTELKRPALLTRGWLSEMPADFQDAILKIGVWRIATPSEAFVRAGDEHGGLVGIETGVAEIAMDRGHPDAPFIHIARPGHWAGFRPILGKVRNVTITAQTEVRWLLVPQSALSRLLDQQPSYWKHLAQLVNESYEVTVSIMVDLTRRNARSRLAAALLRMGGCRFADPDPGSPVEVGVPQSELASIAVMSRNTVSSYLAELAELGLIEIRYRGIRITDASGMRALLDAED